MSIKNRNLKPGTVLVARYKGKDHRCTVVEGEGGKVAYKLKGGGTFKSPSAAGSAVMDGVACNGWRFWTQEDDAPKASTKRTNRAMSPKKGARRAKGGTKAGKGKKGARKAAKPSSNGSKPKAVKAIACVECGEEFPTSREAADHMRKKHGSAEAAGSGGR